MKRETHKSIPDLLIGRAENNARECRMEVQDLKDRMRRKGETEQRILWYRLIMDRLIMYEQDIYEMREFYGTKNIIP